MGIPKAGEDEGMTFECAGVGAAWKMVALRIAVELSGLFILFNCYSYVSVKCFRVGKKAHGEEDARTRIVGFARREHVS